LKREYNIVYAGKGELPLLAIIAIIAAISVCAMLFIMGYCFLRRARKKYNAIQEGGGTE